MKLETITLIRPNMGNYRSGDAFAPLSMAILAARTPAHIKVNFYDDRIEEIPENDCPNLVALTVETFTAKRAYQIAKQYKEKGAIVIMGGYHPTLLPDEALQYADAVVIGDAEGIWETLLEDVANNNLKIKYTGGNEKPLDNYRLDRAIFNNKKYAPVELVQYTRGCKYACEFCSIDAFYNRRVRTRSVESVVEEIKTLNKKRMVIFVDDNLFSSSENVLNLLKAITPLKIKWACQISINIAKDDSMLDALAKSGCLFVLIGFESLSSDNLMQMGKRWNNAYGDYMQVVKRFHQRGIAVYGTFVFGYDNDNVELINRSLKFAKEAKLEIANFNPLTPTPGSRLYDRLKGEGKLLYENWWVDENYKYGEAIFKPKLMSANEFEDYCFNAKKSFYSYKSIFKRVFINKTKFNLFRVFIVLLANYISRKEVINKQNRIIGD